MNLPSPIVLRPEDYADIDPALVDVLNRNFRALYDAMCGLPNSGRAVDLPFTSEASGATVVNVRNPLSSKPAIVSVCVRRDDFTALSAAWSYEFKMNGEQIRLSFIGLPASQKMRLSLEAR